MVRSLLITDATLLLSDGPHPAGWLLVRGGRIADLGWGERRPTDDGAELVDARGLTLAPGLIDLHAHGALSYDTMDADAEGLRAMAHFYARHGVTSFLATTMSAPHEAILAVIETVRIVMAQQTSGEAQPAARLRGVHVEGPYLDLERRGAQDAQQVRRASPDETRELLATGVVRLLTLAPEYSENQALIVEAARCGVAVSLGHSRASAAEVGRAVALGASQVTHLFNGLEPLHHRQPGVVGAALTHDGLRCQLIADTIHVDPLVLKLAYRAKGADGLILVTDAMAGTGMPDGHYHLGDTEVMVSGGQARLPEGNLAGSTLTLERAVGHMMAAADLPLHTAVPMATITPARAMGWTDAGRLVVGAPADLVLLSPDLDVRLTMVGGAIAYAADTDSMW
jgi:N-acetylglucosamine-6-phosphate deacetylase